MTQSNSVPGYVYNELNKARDSGDYATFFRVSREHNVYPSSDEDWKFYDKGMDFVEGNDSELEKMAEIAELAPFIEEVDRLKVSVDDVYSQRDVKQKLIQKYFGYTRLNAPNQDKKSGQKGRKIEFCEDKVVGRAFRSLYNCNCNKIKKLSSA